MTIASNTLKLAALLLGLTLPIGQAAAQNADGFEPTVTLYSFEETNRSYRLLDHRWGTPQVRYGESVIVCFSAPRSGWVNLWSIGADGSFDLIYPNALSGHRGYGIEISANQEYCVGNDEAFRLKVRSNAGEAEVYLNWVASEAELLAPEHYIDLLMDTEWRSRTTRNIVRYSPSRVDVYVPYQVVE